MPRHGLPLLLLWLGAAAALVPAVGHAQAMPPPGCTAPEHRQFDFWVGSWTVADSAGRVLGESDVVRMPGGCGIREHWRGAGGGVGMSLNAWRAGPGQWTQFWVGAGAVLELAGGLDADGRMVLQGERQTADGPLLDRIAWTPLPTGVVRQRWDVSRDGGESWQPSFDGLYRPRADPEVTEADMDPSRDVERALAGIRRAYVDAFNAGDAAGVAALHTEGTISMPAGTPPVVGRDALRELLDASLGAAPPGFRFEFRPEEVRVADGWAVERGVTPPAGDVIPGGKYVMLYVLESDGRWRIAWTITNADRRP